MRSRWFVAAVAVAMLAGPAYKAEAGMIGMPMQLKSAIQSVNFDKTALAPIADTQACELSSDELALGPVSLDALRAIESIPDQLAILSVEIGR